MAPPPQPKEYHDLMMSNGDGHYLYNPLRYRDFHPGSVGYFDTNGAWYKVTDLLEKDERFEPVDDASFVFDEPSEKMWKTVSSGSEAKASFGLDAGLSGALSAAPVDVEANAKHESGSTGQAALITTGVVKEQKFTELPGYYFKEWVRKNIKKLTTGKTGHDIQQHGLYAIYGTYSTQECAIKMKSGYTRDSGGGVGVGATSIGKIGASGSSLQHLKNEGWRTYQAKEGDEGLVVVYRGMGFKFHKMQRLRNTLKVTQEQAAPALVFYQMVTDENGEIVRDENGKPKMEERREIRDENGNVIGSEVVDREAEAREREEKEEQSQEDTAEDEGEFYIACDHGELGEDLPAEDQQPHAGKIEDDITITTREMPLEYQDILRRMEEAKKIPDEAERTAALAKVSEEVKEMIAQRSRGTQ